MSDPIKRLLDQANTEGRRVIRRRDVVTVADVDAQVERWRRRFGWGMGGNAYTRGIASGLAMLLDWLDEPIDTTELEADR
jgi:hypothetical protein